MPRVPWLPLLLAVACVEYRVKGPPSDTESDVADSADCEPCALASAPEGRIAVDPACNHPDFLVVDPYDIELKTEMFVNNSWPDSPTAGGPGALVADLDGDGTPEVVLTDCYTAPRITCELSVFELDGSIRWSEPVPSGALSTAAAADIDGVAGAELIVGFSAVRERTTFENLVALDGEGNLMWSVARGWDAGEPVVVADLDADGAPEFLYMGEVRDARTAVLEASFDGPRAYGEAIAVADVDHDGILEFAESGALFRADGSSVWEMADVSRGLSIALQVDDDPEPEFLFVDEGFVLADTDGTVISSVDAPWLDFGNAVLADLDADGAPELVLSGQFGSLTAFRLDGSVLWERTGLVGPMSGWDVDGDGASELIVQGNGEGEEGSALAILAGVDGSILYTTPHLAFGSDLAPLVADIDGDGHAELLVGGGAPRDGLLPTVSVYHQVDDTWPAAGPAWPVPDYHLANVGAAGEIPRGETDPPWWTHNVYHARPAVDGQGVNLTPSVAATCADVCAGANVQFNLLVTNVGPMPATDVPVRVYAGDIVVADLVLGRIGAGTTSEGTLVMIPAASFDLGDVRVVVDPDGIVPECEESDNEVGVTDPR